MAEVVDEPSRGNGENVTAAPLLQSLANNSNEETCAGFNYTTPPLTLPFLDESIKQGSSIGAQLKVLTDWWLWWVLSGGRCSEVSN